MVMKGLCAVPFKAWSFPAGLTNKWSCAGDCENEALSPNSNATAKHADPQMELHEIPLTQDQSQYPDG